jgi:hypothetical protein
MRLHLLHDSMNTDDGTVGALDDEIEEDDPAIDALPAEARGVIALVWSTRAESELAAAGVFSRLDAAVRARDAAPEVLALLGRAPAEETRHAAICRKVARRYGVTSESAPVPTPALPTFGQADAALNATLNVVLNCCISETVAVEFLRTCRAAAHGTTVQRALRLLLRDEMNHARVGWAHLASSQVGERERREVGAALPVLARIARAAWTKSPGPPAAEATGHGWLSDESVGELFDGVMNDVIVPGLRHVGVVPP